MEIDCTLCGRKTPEEYIEKHHLTPKSRKGKETVLFCCDCGDQVHKLFTNKELDREYNTLEKLRANESVQKWISWIRKRPNKFGFCMKSKKKKEISY